MHNLQQCAANVVGQVLAGHNLNQTLEVELKKQKNFTPQERGALKDICYGTLRNFGQLSKILQELLSKSLKDAKIRNLLLIALYQLQFSKAAQYAIVDHAVQAAKEINIATGGLVNAVLRNYLRKQSELTQLSKQTDEGLYSYQAWWIQLIKKQYGEKADRILKAGNQHPPMTLRVNRRHKTSKQYLSDLIAKELEAQLTAPDAIILKTPHSVDNLPGFFEGEVSVQDAGAQYAAKLLDVKNGMNVLDACSAPGGKCAHLLELYDIDLLALDKDEKRLGRVQENLQRLKLKANLACGDASQPKSWWDGKKFERILADVPCSASGVVRRHPDIKLLRRPSDIESFAKQQEEILEALWPLLSSGGKLLYATCSVFDRENQQVIDAFISRHSDVYQQTELDPDLINGQLLPDDWHDGFFYALLQKIA